MRILILFLFLGFLTSCGTTAPEADKEKLKLVLTPSSFNDLPGWGGDPQNEALAAFAKSCKRILKKEPTQAFGPDNIGGTFGDWQPACRALPASNAAAFFAQWFAPWEAAMEGGETQGLFTGYYESSLRGSRVRASAYQYPLYKRPPDLVMVDLGEFREELKGQRIAGRVKDFHLKPYEDRAKIEAGQWPHNGQVLVWVDDPVDSFFLHIQGSGRVELAEGGSMRVGYDGQNGHVYYAVGRELVKHDLMKKEDVSMQSIRAWLEAHPDEAQDFMNLNKSYVFFKELTEEGPEGGEGVALTPGRSLAIDRSKIPYGVPVWVDIESPVADEPEINRLMIAQDTGGAIQGAVRGDVFWGHGARAEHIAGQMKANGRYWLLLPKSAAR